MEIKKSYVYKSIRKAGIESLFSYQTIFLCLMTIGTISSIAFFWAGEFEVWMIVADILFALLQCCPMVCHTAKYSQLYRNH